ncbi:MAG: amino terminal protease self-immunity [Microbacterium sp.]|jgi:membrane protease YdiL (CAAX protease family)|uniref:CPBP family intramembrane glutamic endopeptidase n=1 Tax=Microbacterium sp. TaxID=51671 RepID=UPI00262A9869|nr:CPBP family intramembrane glutamic endopeptidase [Microbacterium sp.]MDF2558559.1 amino terminal protease self-immunity [Microbacterium sp.]
MSVPLTTSETGAHLRPTSGWQLFLALYAALTVWIFVGRELVAEPVFAGVKNGGYVVLAILGIWLFRDGFARSWRTTKQRPLLAAGAVLLGLALMAVASGANYLMTQLVATPTVGANQAAISAEVLVASTSLVGGLTFVGIGGVAAPVVEELVFREIPFARLRRLLSTRTAFVLSCLVFGAIHLRSLDEWPLAILYIGFSAALAAAYLLSKRNLLVSITAHVLWNGTGLAYLVITAA